MNEQEQSGKVPEFSGDGIAVWVNIDRNGNKYLSVKKPEWGKSLNCFTTKPKVEFTDAGKKPDVKEVKMDREDVL